MKKILLSTVVAAIVLVLFASCGKSSEINISLIEDINTVQAFTNDKVPDADIKKIVNAGLNAQSALNKQPWHFTVITSEEVMGSLSEAMKSSMPPRRPAPPADMNGDMKAPPAPPAPGMDNGPKAAMGDSPLMIVVSGKDGSEFDVGLAAELMTVEAVLLGYGTKIISSPTIVLNGPDKAQYQKKLGIPEDMSAKAVILIGKYAQSKEADAVSGASTRKSKDELVTYIN